MVQDEDAAEYDYAASEWPSEYDDGAHYGWDDNEPDADEEHWSGEEIFDSQAAYYQTDAEEAHEHDYHGTMWRPMTLPMRLTWVPERGFSVVWQDLSELVGWLLVWLSYCVGLDGP